MKSNLPSTARTPLPKLKPAEALKQPGFYFVVSSIMPLVETAEAGVMATPVCVMLVNDGKMYICNPTQNVTMAELADGLTFQGPIRPDKE